MEEPSPSLREMVESVRLELDGYSRTRRCGRSLRRPLSNLAFCSCWMIERIDELEHLIHLWRDVAFQRGPGHKVATRYLTFAFSNLSREIHSLLTVDKSRIDPRELQALENISPETVAVLPFAAKRITEEGLAFLETQSQSPRRISELRFHWLETLRNLEAFVDDDRFREARGRVLRELKSLLVSPRLQRPGALKLLETLSELEPDSDADSSTICLLQWIVDHPLSRDMLERALCLQVRYGLENEYDAECILGSWSFSLRGGGPECDGGSEGP